jgi:hypothetical protein
VAFKLMRPAFIPTFRRDVLEYVITGSFIGSAAMALLFAVTYFATGLSIDAARSALSIFATLFGILIFWNTFGIDLSQPRTLLQHRGVTLMGLGFAMLVLLGFYIAPELFEFAAPTMGITALIISTFLLTVVMFSTFMKNRYFISRLWTLFAP